MEVPLSPKFQEKVGVLPSDVTEVPVQVIASVLPDVTGQLKETVGGMVLDVEDDPWQAASSMQALALINNNEKIFLTTYIQLSQSSIQYWL